ncbi:MAG: hypothetical protein REI09_07560 [Candidatus Dactylopiibacterium sp.]|nr:hypothetical protein [Candidatus Dactylopiibacterium sp.]
MATWLANLQDSALATALRSDAWAYPVLEALHIVGLALVFGSLWFVDLRLLGWACRTMARDALLRALLPWTLAGFGLAATSGALMFATQASELAVNAAFRFKLALLGLAALNAGLLHVRGVPDDGLTRAQAGASLLIWLAVIACGRAIAYI